jgi:hypothetical protein
VSKANPKANAFMRELLNQEYRWPSSRTPSGLPSRELPPQKL